MPGPRPGRRVSGTRLAELPVLALGPGLTVHVACSWSARRRGLAGLDAPTPGTALWLVPCRSVHTFGMRFALDLVWLDRAGDVLRVDRDVAPRRQRSMRSAASVIEAASGGGDVLVEAWTAARARGFAF